jgi:uncharacterized protein (DUF2252 family)
MENTNIQFDSTKVGKFLEAVIRYSMSVGRAIHILELYKFALENQLLNEIQYYYSVLERDNEWMIQQLDYKLIKEVTIKEINAKYNLNLDFNILYGTTFSQLSLFKDFNHNRDYEQKFFRQN